MKPISLFSLFFLSFFSFSSSQTTIPLGSSLSASNPNQTWSSPNNTFYVGFTPASPSTYTAAVNFDGGVPIWTAGPAVDSGATLRLLSDGNLQLLNGSGSPVWSSGTASVGVDSASIDDFGNLVLRNRTGFAVWSSFANPTDTIVPNQTFGVNQVFHSGYYSFQLLRSGNLTLRWNDSIVYWNEGLNSSVNVNLTSPRLGLQSVGILSILDSNLPRGYIVAYSNDYAEGTDVLRFLKLDTDGNLRMYSSDRGSGRTTMRWAALTDQCQVYGYCGNFGICSYNDTSSTPICGCPSQNFVPVDANDENILLDENHNAKVSDFGLAKLIHPKDHRHRTLTSVRGTRGYLAPEWLANLPITSKSDVYSFGMVLLEIVSGRRNFDVSEQTNRKKFSLWAYEEYDKGNVTAILDKRLATADVDMEQVTRAIEVSFWCIQEQPSQRPMMGKVVQMLEGVADCEKPPAPKVVTEGSVSGTSINISSNVSALSTFASAPAPSSSSSHQTMGISPIDSENKLERASFSLLHSAPN
ncbi:hypothetical protein Tsubulata_021103 [Turnera subulata]|uniref:non-specific serine/threonine protein kinase n=1 Tax=Turnera subulata TaxID=218843 RepID=A0A9Q0GGV2_9ROSI|nr:hypothetical protein Tsubulata_021103 [Turnera subulata]